MMNSEIESAAELRDKSRKFIAQLADDRQKLLHVIDFAVKELGLVMHDARRRNIRESLERVANKVKGATNADLSGR